MLKKKKRKSSKRKIAWPLQNSDLKKLKIFYNGLFNRWIMQTLCLFKNIFNKIHIKDIFKCSFENTKKIARIFVSGIALFLGFVVVASFRFAPKELCFYRLLNCFVYYFYSGTCTLLYVKYPRHICASSYFCWVVNYWTLLITKVFTVTQL